MVTRKKRLRKKTPTANETSVLMRSARRCVLCFHLKGHLTEKDGQIAHLDENPANGAEENLAWMCLRHHSKYDSKNSQHKNYTIAEVKEARERLYAAIERHEHKSGMQHLIPKTITEIMELLGENDRRKALDPLTLQSFLHDKIGNLAERWFKRGFNRGHKESLRAFDTSGRVPLKIEFECSRKLSPGQERALTLRSTIKKVKPTSRKKRA